MNNTPNVTASIEDRILDLISDALDTPREQLGRETRLHEIGDSLDRVETVMEIEDEFEISLPDEAVDTVRTLGELIELVTTTVGRRDQQQQQPRAPHVPR